MICEYEQYALKMTTSQIVALLHQRYRLLAELDKQKRLLQRCKELFEPFPVVSDLRSMSKFLREKHDEKEAAAIEELLKKQEAKDRKLYRDIVQILKEK